MIDIEVIKDGVVEELYCNGQLESKRNYNNGKLQGFMEVFYKNGQLRYRVNFNDHDRDGRPWEKFYRDGRRDGPWEKFYEDGRLQSRGNFIEAHTIAIHLRRIIMFEHSKKYTSSQSCKLKKY